MVVGIPNAPFVRPSVHLCAYVLWVAPRAMPELVQPGCQEDEGGRGGERAGLLARGGGGWGSCAAAASPLRGKNQIPPLNAVSIGYFNEHFLLLLTKERKDGLGSKMQRRPQAKMEKKGRERERKLPVDAAVETALQVDTYSRMDNMNLD